MKPLSIYHWEDILAVNEGQEFVFVLYIRNHKDVTEGKFSGLVETVTKHEKREGIGGDKIKINNIEYITVKAKMTKATYNLQAQTGGMTA